MHRIDSATATVDNKFTHGNPSTATPATVITADWLNMVQEELATVIAAASITMSKPDNTQLLAAIRALGTPIGAVQAYAGSSAPAGFLLCFGQAVSRTTYAALFTAIGTAFGVGDGSTTFNLPDLRGRTVAGKDDMGGTAASRLTSSGTGNPGIAGSTLGAAGGVDRLSLTVAQMPAHSHPSYAQSSGSITNSGGTTYVTSLGNSNTVLSTVTQDIGSGNAHPIVQPTIVLNYIIKT